MKKFILLLLLLALVMSVAPVQAQEDEEFVLGSGGRTLFTDHRPVPAKTQEQEQAAVGQQDQIPTRLTEPLVPLEDTFLLHSYPIGTQILFLDFDGYKVKGPDLTPFDMDGDDTTFSDAELLRIQEVWQSVSEDFLPFNIDVTTEDPGVDPFVGQRAVIDGGRRWSYSWAYLGDWEAMNSSYAYIFPGNNSWIWIADSVSHEVGHTLNLRDHGSLEDGQYYHGHGSGDTFWAPIMGWTKTTVPYGLSQWDKGEYLNPTLGINTTEVRREDSLAIIDAVSGVDFRADDHGNDIATSTVIALPSTLSLVADGIIEQCTDVDYFEFTTTGGNVKFSINEDCDDSDASHPSSNLDVLAKIHDFDDTVLYTSNPASEIYASFDVSLPAGTYYLSIDGTGLNDPLGPPDDGYSDYGSLGYYSILAMGPTEIDPDVTPPTPDPMTFATAPYATGESSLAMVATTAIDTENGVEYKFTCTAGGGNDSPWQADTFYEDTGLLPETQYTYTVTARDTSGNQNETAPSAPESAITDADAAPPTPDPITWDVVPTPGRREDPLIYEPFDYSVGPLNGVATNALGLTGDWTAGSITAIEAGSATYGSLPVTGNRVDLSATNNSAQAYCYAALDTSVLIGYLDDSDVLWFAAVARTSGTVTGNSLRFQIGLGASNNVGFLMDQLTIETSRVRALATNGGSETLSSGSGTFGGGNQLVVGKITFGATDTVEVYMPGTDLVLPASPVGTVQTTLDQTATDWIQINMENGNSMICADEICIGTTYESVTGQLVAGSTDNSISMTATVASDVSGVEYYFDEITGNPGGTDSGWQDSHEYIDTDLTPGTQYTYTVTARDKSAAQNETLPSTEESAMTTGGVDTDPPTPNPATFASAPAAVSSTEITMTATTGTDATGPVQYFFDETSGNPGGTDSGWVTDPVYNDTGLDPDTQYTYTVTMRDSVTPTPNVGTTSSPASATTNPAGQTSLTDDFEGTLANWSTDWDLVTDYYQSATHSVQCSSEDNDLISIDVDTSGASTSVTVQFKYRMLDIDANDNVSIYYWDGSAYDFIDEIGDDAQGTWLTYDHTTTDSQYRNSTFKIYIEGSSIDPAELLWIDDVSITCQ